MRVSNIIYNDVTKYKKKSATIMICNGGQDEPAPVMKDEDVIEDVLESKYMDAIVFAGDEPYEQIDDIISFVKNLREYHHSDIDVVIYTEYYPTDILISKIVRDGTDSLSKYKNIYIKWGRTLGEDEEHIVVFDKVLGVFLPSDNQYVDKIS